jgi:hypothetical protein
LAEQGHGWRGTDRFGVSLGRCEGKRGEVVPDATCLIPAPAGSKDTQSWDLAILQLADYSVHRRVERVAAVENQKDGVK